MRMTLTVRTTDDGKLAIYHRKRMWIIDPSEISDTATLEDAAEAAGELAGKLIEEALAPVSPFKVVVQHPATGEGMPMRIIAANGDAAQREARSQVAGSIRHFDPDHLTIVSVEEEGSGEPAVTN